jgi:UDP-glucose 4-epimerase
MKVLVTGSSGHLGEALVRTLRDLQYQVISLDILESPFTTHIGSITDRAWVRRCMSGNIYGVTKAVAEDLCELFFRNQGLACMVLRTSRFFPEDDDNRKVRQEYSGANAKANELLYRRVDMEDVVSAHLLAAERAVSIGFRKYIISATTPFLPGDLTGLRANAREVLRLRVPEYEAEYARRQWKAFSSIDRVYVNERARNELGWRPQYDFQAVVRRLQAGDDMRSPLSLLVGSKGYHAQVFSEGPYPVE